MDIRKLVGAIRYPPEGLVPRRSARFRAVPRRSARFLARHNDRGAGALAVTGAFS